MDKMYKEGGLATDGMDVDPVSGNDIPVGSNAEDVRDDVDTKLSSGEYVVPADVVKYLGVAQLEKLVDKAKVGLEDMEANGRIGGEPVAEPEEVVMTLGGDLATLDGYATGGMVEGTDIDGIINRVKAAAEADPSIINMLKSKGIFVKAPEVGQPSAPAAAPAAVATQQQPPAFAEGGVVGSPLTNEYDPANFTSDFDPYAHTPGFSAGLAAPVVPTAPVAETPTCPPGQLWDPVQNMCVPVEQPKSDRSSDNGAADVDQGDPNAWMEKFDYSNPETLFKDTMGAIGGGSDEEGGLLGGVLGLAKGVFAGGVIGKFMATNNAAQAAANSIVLREMGRDDLADKIDNQYGTYVKSSGINNVPKSWRDGDRLAASIKENRKDNLDGWGSTSKGLASKPTSKADPVSDKVKAETGAVSNTTTLRKSNKTSDQKASQTNTDSKRNSQAATVRESEAKASGSVPTGRSTMGSDGKKKETYASKVQRGGGYAKGGLVDNKTTKKGLGRK